MANALQQQIETQRQSISSQKQQLAQATQRASQIPQQQLRGTDKRSTLGKVGSALMKRLQRGRQKERYEKPLEQISKKQLEFEREVAKKAPKYAKPELVQREYQKAQQAIGEKISEIDTKISTLQQRYQEAQASGNERRADTAWRYLQQAQEEKNVLGSYLEDPMKAIKGVSSGRAFQEAQARGRGLGKSIESSAIQSQQLKEAGFKNVTEYAKAKPILSAIEEGTATQEQIASLPKKIQEKITYTEVPTEQIGGFSEMSQQSLTRDRFMEAMGYQAVSTPFGVKYEEVDRGRDFRISSQVQEEFKDLSPESGASPEIQPWEYQPKSGTFVSTARGVPDISRSTLIMRQPTISERAVINDRTNILSYSQAEIERMSKLNVERQEKLRELTRELEDYSKDKIKTTKVYDDDGRYTLQEEWIGTPEEYKIYEDKFKTIKAVEEVVKREAPELRAGLTWELSDKMDRNFPVLSFLGKASTDVDISQPEFQRGGFDLWFKGYGLSTAMGVGGGLGRETIELTGDIPIVQKGSFLAEADIGRINLFGERVGDVLKQPSRLKDYFRGGTPDIIYSLDEGVARKPTEKDFAKVDIVNPSEFKLGERKLTPELAGKIGGVAGAIGFYAGAELALSPVLGSWGIPALAGASLGQAMIQEKGVVKGATRYFKDYPEEAIIVGGLTALKGYGATLRYLRSPVRVTTPTGFKVTTRLDEFLGRKIVGTTDDVFGSPFFGPRLKTLPSQRGRAFDFLEVTPKQATLRTDPSAVLTKEGAKFDDFINLVKDSRGQKILQVVDKGQRTKVTETVPRWFRSDKVTTLYEGIPYVDKIGYKTQLNYLTNLFGEKYARQALRYTAPTVQEQYLRGAVKIKGNVGIGRFVSTIEKPRYVVDEALGIKTRGGRTLKDVRGALNIGGDKGGFTLVSGGQFEVGRGLINLKGIDIKGGFYEVTGKRIFDIKNLGITRISTRSVKTYIPRDKNIFIDTSSTYLVRQKGKDEVVSVFRGETSKSSKQFLENLYKQELLQVTPPSLIKTPKITKKTPPPQISESMNIVEGFTTEGLPLMVGGTGLKDIPFGGTGNYEVTETEAIITGGFTMPSMTGSVISNVNQEKIDNSLVLTQPIQRGGVGEGLGFSPLSVSKQPIKIKEVLSLGYGLDTGIGVKPIGRVGIKEVQATKTDTRLSSKQIASSATAQATSLMQIPRPTQPRRTKPTRPKPKRPTKLIPTFNLGEKSKKRRILKQKRKSDDEFLAITKRYGKEVVIGKGKDLGKVITLGKQRVRKTLGATLKVKTTKGKQVQLTPTKGFRPGKRDPLAIVQKRERRLGTLGERKEIKRARRGALSLA